MLTKELIPNNSVTSVFVLASYMEFENLGYLIPELLSQMDTRDTVIIVDDSGFENIDRVTKIVSNASEPFETKVFISFSDSKNGRGAGIRRGFELAYNNFEKAKYFIEMDSDGSHRAKDAIEIAHTIESDLVIGSRYLQQSEIHGWPLTRRFFSRILNFMLPRIFSINSSDLTNGLRRYSRTAVSILLDNPQMQRGFIYLTEQALILKAKNIHPKEIPIKFSNRIEGVSSVGLSEVLGSLKGVYYLWKSGK